MKIEQLAWTLNDILLRPKRWKRDMTFGTCIVRSLHVRFTYSSSQAIATEKLRFSEYTGG